MTSSDLGRLRVSMPSLAPDVRPAVNVIDGESLALVEALLPDVDVVLPAGTYLVTATMPSGERSLDVVEVSAGELQEVEVSEPTAPERAAAVAQTAEGPPLERLGVGESPTPPEPLEATSWFLRVLSLGPQSGVEMVNPPVTVDRVLDKGRTADLVVQATGTGLMFAQVAAPGQVPLNVALPINGSTFSQSCRLTVSLANQNLEAAVAMMSSARMDAVARYLDKGSVREAADVTADAEELLRQKMADPFGAAIGGYVLLRLGNLERLHHWPRNLARFFPWLPDGPIIAGEEAALEADHKVAVKYFCEGARRGLPVFADGFSILVARAREYAQAAKPPKGVSAALHKEVRVHADRLLPLTPFMHFARISLAFHGARLDDPAGSQEPVESPTAADGWRRFSAQAGTLA